jgi:hypothetical protein
LLIEKDTNRSGINFRRTKIDAASSAEKQFKINASLSDSRKRLCNEKDQRFLICLLRWKILNIDQGIMNLNSNSNLKKGVKTLPLREGCWDVDEMEKAINRFRIEWGMTIKNRASTF